MPHDGHDHTDPPPDPALRVKALESLLVEKGLIDPDVLDVLIDTYEHKVGPRNGARVVAKAWSDDAFKAAIKSAEGVVNLRSTRSVIAKPLSFRCFCNRLMTSRTSPSCTSSSVN